MVSEEETILGLILPFNVTVDHQKMKTVRALFHFRCYTWQADIGRCAGLTVNVMRPDNATASSNLPVVVVSMTRETLCFELYLTVS